MADRIRVNGTAFASYAGMNTDNDYQQDCLNSDCDPAQMVTADAAEWSEKLQGLPSGQGIIIGDANGLELRVLWDDENTGAKGTDCGPDPDRDLTCYRITLLP